MNIDRDLLFTVLSEPNEKNLEMVSQMGEVTYYVMPLYRTWLMFDEDDSGRVYLVATLSKLEKGTDYYEDVFSGCFNVYILKELITDENTMEYILAKLENILIKQYHEISGKPLEEAK